jgi:hypothetical protein
MVRSPLVLLLIFAMAVPFLGETTDALIVLCTSWRRLMAWQESASSAVPPARVIQTKVTVLRTAAGRAAPGLGRAT